MDLGVVPARIYNRLFDQNRLDRLQLLGYLLSEKIELIEDGKVAYRYLLEKGYLPQNIVVSGGSVGGGLALGTMLALRDDGEVLPATIAVMSPWVDLTLSGDTFDTLKDVAVQFLGSDKIDEILADDALSDADVANILSYIMGDEDTDETP